MGDLEEDTAVTRIDDDRFAAHLSREWEIWGPMGGYVAAVALRAAGAASPFDRPASLFCHYLGVAAFDEVQLEVTTLRTGRNASSQRITMHQGERPILEATVWSIGEVEGLEHHVAEPPAVPGPGELKLIQELIPEEEQNKGPGFPFWSNLDVKPTEFRTEWPPKEPAPPVFQEWARFTPTPTFTDPWVDACRSAILVDVQSWPSASRHHAWEQPPFMAPSLDFYLAFHESTADTEWLLMDGYAPVARDGLIGWNGRLWTPSGRLVASGGGQALCRRVDRRG